MSREDEPQIDKARSCNLDGGRAAVVVIYADGEEWLWLLDDPAGDTGCACSRCAPHEQLATAVEA
ncbi:hypothetical protein FB382_001868 [Nocardioides ginsengisegetis]|uniref:Uncharacterized protein n=1 Tax=Nocardioides ginsengisegetis TaxID=661491 RepID=A0A7W3P9M3_9ACTN|nr:hypothetical protein [Nocardioides ginsengisegetis]MBA8803577.1 hypothetical protein [Nocardioides ginsengisegetis]